MVKVSELKLKWGIRLYAHHQFNCDDYTRCICCWFCLLLILWYNRWGASRLLATAAYPKIAEATSASGRVLTKPRLRKSNTMGHQQVPPRWGAFHAPSWEHTSGWVVFKRLLYDTGAIYNKSRPRSGTYHYSSTRRQPFTTKSRDGYCRTPGILPVELQATDAMQ